MISIKTGSFRLYLRLKSKKQSAILCGSKDCGLLLSTGLFEGIKGGYTFHLEKEPQKVYRGALSAVLKPEQKSRKVSNLLQKMKAEGSIIPKGPRNRAKWYLVKDDETK